MLTRHSNWQTLFHAYLTGNPARFHYGSHDCCLFVAGAVEAMTGTDIAAAYRGKYSTRKQALQVASGMFGARTVEGIVEQVAKAHSMPEISPLHASRGDMVLLQPQKGRDHLLGIVSLTGTRILIAIAKGFGSVPITNAYRAWKV